MGRAFEVRKVAMAKTQAAKSKVYSKYGKEIYVTAKNGGPDPDTNLSLRRLIEKAKKIRYPPTWWKRPLKKPKAQVVKITPLPAMKLWPRRLHGDRGLPDRQ